MVPLPSSGSRSTSRFFISYMALWSNVCFLNFDLVMPAGRMVGVMRASFHPGKNCLKCCVSAPWVIRLIGVQSSSPAVLRYSVAYFIECSFSVEEAPLPIHTKMPRELPLDRMYASFSSSISLMIGRSVISSTLSEPVSSDRWKSLTFSAAAFSCAASSVAAAMAPGLGQPIFSKNSVSSSWPSSTIVILARHSLLWSSSRTFRATSMACCRSSRDDSLPFHW
mmetsp:Transcript_21422/g.55862  ORF Transcript_21422/g.55862 Transcript_21422/m.55862 type:complete len:223 (+) Transcript_21422:1414-2082(+)